MFKFWQHAFDLLRPKKSKWGKFKIHIAASIRWHVLMVQENPKFKQFPSHRALKASLLDSRFSMSYFALKWQSSLSQTKTICNRLSDWNRTTRISIGGAIYYKSLRAGIGYQMLSDIKSQSRCWCQKQILSISKSFQSSITQFGISLQMPTATPSKFLLKRSAHCLVVGV